MFCYTCLAKIIRNTASKPKTKQCVCSLFYILLSPNVRGGTTSVFVLECAICKGQFAKNENKDKTIMQWLGVSRRHPSRGRHFPGEHPPGEFMYYPILNPERVYFLMTCVIPKLHKVLVLGQ